MKQSASSRRWLQQHHSDPFVLQARREGYRSRAVYKLKELQAKHRLIRAGDRVLDLGAAPGGWSQYAAELVGDAGLVVAVDKLPIPALPGVTAIQGDCQDAAIEQILQQHTAEHGFDVVLSDMAPNTSGIKTADQLKSMQLAEEVAWLSEPLLSPGGRLVVKVFQGPGFDPWMSHLKSRFSRVLCQKPRASRSQSPEVYVLAMQRKMV